MSDDFPRRLRHDRRLDPRVHGILRSDAGDRPSATTQAKMLASLLAKLPPGGAPPSTPGGGEGGDVGNAASVAKGLGAGAAAKVVGVVVLTAGVALVARGFSPATDRPIDRSSPNAGTTSEPRPTSPALSAELAPAESLIEAKAAEASSEPAPTALHANPAPAAPSSREGSSREPSAVAGPEPATSTPPVVAEAPSSSAGDGAGTPTTAPSSSAAADRTTMLRAEGLALGAARDALRAGHPTRALELLDQARAGFPNGVLGQEREALTIEALWSAGRTSEASARGEAFLTRFPGSPYAGRVRSFVK
jgi:hypothetical protein